MPVPLGPRGWSNTPAGSDPVDPAGLVIWPFPIEAAFSEPIGGNRDEARHTIATGYAPESGAPLLRDDVPRNAGRATRGLRSPRQ